MHCVRWWRWPQRWASQLRNGLRLPWASEARPPRFDDGNYDSADDDQIHTEFDRLLGWALEGPFPESALGADIEVVSPIGGVVKETTTGRKVRAVVDLTRSGVNPFLAQLPVALSSIDEVMTDAKHGDFMAKLDMSDYFFTYRVCEDDRRFLGVRHPRTGELYRYTRLPFGLRSSPFLACSLMHEACAIIRSRFTAAHPGVDFGCYDYVDDLLLRASDETHCAALVNVARRVFDQLGLIIAEHKTEEPTQTLTFLGLQLSTADMTLSVDSRRLQEITACTSDFVREFQRGRRSRAPRRAIARLAGKLSFAARAVRSGRAHLRSLFDALYGTGACSHFDWDAADLADRGLTGFATLGPAVWSDLAFWTDCLSSWNGVSFRSQVGDTADFEAEFFTDASSYGYGASRRITGDDEGGAELPSERIAGIWEPHEASRSSNWRELRAILLAVRAWASRSWRGRRVLVNTDNTTAVSVISRGASATPELLQMVREIHCLEAEFSFELVARHISGDLMILHGTDGLSRGTVAASTSDWRIRRAAFDQLEEEVGGHDVDAYAAADGGHLLPVFCTETASALERDFAGTCSWNNPPHYLIGAALRHFLECRARAPYSTAGSFLLPEWRSAAWWRLARYFRTAAKFEAGSLLFERRDPETGQWVGGFRTRWPVVLWRADRVPTPAPC